MRAGRLRQQVEIERPLRTADTYGQPVVTWVSLGMAWAGITLAGGGEVPGGPRAQGTERYAVELRWRADVDASCRLLWGAKVLQFATCADPDGKRRQLKGDAEVKV